jgi:NMD protein affecting ribosome stability and mRNA decay
MITVICAWCGREIGHKEGGEGISHGLCRECYEVLEQEVDDIIREVNDLRERLPKRD